MRNRILISMKRSQKSFSSLEITKLEKSLRVTDQNKLKQANQSVINCQDLALVYNKIIDKFSNTCSMLTHYNSGIIYKSNIIQLEKVKSITYEEAQENINRFIKCFITLFSNFYFKQFDLDLKFLTKEDIDYINTCISHISETYMFKEYAHYFKLFSHPYINLFSFSIGFKKGLMNPNRFYFGLNSFPEDFIQARDKVLKKRGISIPNTIIGSEVAGIGYDTKANILKTFHFGEAKDIPKETINEAMLDQFYNDVLISQAFDLSTKNIVENRFYIYPKNKKFIDNDIQLPYVLMISDKRGEIYQYDFNDNSVQDSDIKHLITEKGREVIKIFREINCKLDCVEYKDQDNFNLYYPSLDIRL